MSNKDFFQSLTYAFLLLFGMGMMQLTMLKGCEMTEIRACTEGKGDYGDPDKPKSPAACAKAIRGEK